jgi:hypothetical protein
VQGSLEATSYNGRSQGLGLLLAPEKAVLAEVGYVHHPVLS